MNKRLDMHDLDIPKDDIECWERYSKHRWIFDLSRVLDAQNIKWSPYEIDDLPNKELNIKLQSLKPIICHPGFIYTRKPDAHFAITEMYIIKGEIKLLRHLDQSGSELNTIFGDVELRLNAFVTLYFQKFTGVVTTETWGNEIFRIKLCPYGNINHETNNDVIKLIRRIYKKNDLNLHGLTDRPLQEALAS